MKKPPASARTDTGAESPFDAAAFEGEGLATNRAINSVAPKMARRHLGDSGELVIASHFLEAPVTVYIPRAVCAIHATHEGRSWGVGPRVHRGRYPHVKGAGRFSLPGSFEPPC